MEPDLTFDLVNVVDEAIPQRDGSFSRGKKYTFYLGKFGPFVERIKLDEPNPLEFQMRRDKLVAHLRDLHR